MEPPTFVQKPANKDVKEGTKVRFDCTVKGKPTPEVTWWVLVAVIVDTRWRQLFITSVLFVRNFNWDKWLCVRSANDAEVKPDSRVKTETKEAPTGLVASLIIDSVTVDDVATFKATAKNPAGEVSCSAELTVQGWVYS